MTTQIIITKGQHKNKKARVIGVYMNGNVDAKIGNKWIVLAKKEFYWID